MHALVKSYRFIHYGLQQVCAFASNDNKPNQTLPSMLQELQFSQLVATLFPVQLVATFNEMHAYRVGSFLFHAFSS